MVFEALPEDVAGFASLAERRKAFTSWVNERRTRAQHARNFTEFSFAMAGARHEVLASRGLWVARRVSDAGHDYFVANYSARPLEDWVPLGVRFTEIWILDPLDGRWGRGQVRRSASGREEVYLQMSPGQSLLLRTRTRGPASTAMGPEWPYVAPAGPPVFLLRVHGMQPLSGDAPAPRPQAEGRLGSWTESEDPALAKFTGTVRYKLQVHVDEPADEWWLDLGDVRETARVSLDGKPLGTLWSRPFRLRLGALAPGSHELHVDVTSSAANRVRDLDQRKVDWKIMKDTNLVTLRYRPFDAASWAPQPSGLLGPVALLPMNRLSPAALTAPRVP